MRLMVYSHDSFGLGNIRRMLAICQHLLATVPQLSILLVSGSPVIHSFRLPPGLDYIKLPCLGRDRLGKLGSKYLTTDLAEAIKLRSKLIETAVVNFQPNLVLVDKKPYGLCGELEGALEYINNNLPQTKLVLLLRDILDSPQATIKEWQQHKYNWAIQRHYDRILVVGTPQVFNPIKEYKFPASIAKKVRFCGYIRKESVDNKLPEVIRQELQVAPEEKLVLVTAGGGGDGYSLVKNYLLGLEQLPTHHNIKSLIISGPEMPSLEQEALASMIRFYPGAIALEFTDDLMSYMKAADLVVSMGGYNTVTEILSLNKKAVVVPRIKPVTEQLIRAERMAKLGLLTAIHPDELTPVSIAKTVLHQLESNRTRLTSQTHLDLRGLPRIQAEILQLLFTPNKPQSVAEPAIVDRKLTKCKQTPEGSQNALCAPRVRVRGAFPEGIAFPKGKPRSSYGRVPCTLVFS